MMKTTDTCRKERRETYPMQGLRMGYCGTFDAIPEKLCSKGAASTTISLIAFFTEDRKHKLWNNCYTDRELALMPGSQARRAYLSKIERRSGSR
jgi:hypothetical protein